MSKYTTEIRFICENAAGENASVGYSSVDRIISAAIPKVFDFNFPIFDEAYRNVLCGKILKHYYTREIGEETVGLWKLRLNTRMNEIMPYYNKLYRSETYEFNPMYDVDYTRSGEKSGDSKDTFVGNKERNVTDSEENSGSTTQNKTVSSTRTGSSETNGGVTGKNVIEQTSTDKNTTTRLYDETDNTKDLYSETPQGTIVNLDNQTYLTNARITTHNGDGSSKDDVDGSGSLDRTETRTDSYNDESSSTDTQNTTDIASGSNTETKNKTISDTVTDNDTRNINNTEEYVERVSGKMGTTSYAKMLMEYRESLINIDMMIINALADLFFGLW